MAPLSSQSERSTTTKCCSGWWCRASGVVAFVFWFSGGCVGVSQRWKPIYDDRAQKTWAAGDCLVIDRETRVKVHESSEGDSYEYQAFIHVLRLSEHNASSHHSTRVRWYRGDEYDDVTVATIFDGSARAVQLPHQAKYRRSGKMREMGAWYYNKDEPNEFKNQYLEGDIVTCHWDVDHPKKVAMTNDGGDWTVFYLGLVMLCAPPVIFFMSVWYARSNELPFNGVLVRHPTRRPRPMTTRPITSSAQSRRCFCATWWRPTRHPTQVAIPAGARPGATVEVAMPPAASRHADVPPPPQTRAPPNPDRAHAYSDEARAALRAIDDAAALRAQLRAIDTEGARDEPATWAEWFGFCANPDPEPATGQMPPQQGAVQTGVVGQPQQGVVMDQPQAPQGSVIQAQGKFVHSSQAPQGTVVGVETV